MSENSRPAPVLARLTAPFDLAGSALADASRRIGMKTEQSDNSVRISLSRGDLLAVPENDETLVSLSAVDGIGLQVLRDLMARLSTEIGIALSWDDPLPIGRPANLSLARVVEVAHLSPAYIRVTIAGPDLDRFASGGLHFTLPQGPAGADWPYTDEGGVTTWPEGIGAWHRPVFTIRSLVQGAAETRITFDVFLHAGGRTPDWAVAAKTGDEVAMMGPTGSALPAPTGFLGLFADETAIPAAARMLAAADPDTRGTAVFVVPEAADIQDIPHPAGMSVTWALRSDGADLLDHLAVLDLPDSDRFVFFAAEKAQSSAARQVLTDRGLVRGEFLVSAYWTRRADPT